ncbi:uncharacterized protein LOC103502987 isoform X2 [Cucumis melo]|uniref:Uncharacterized protein LOC103502987 isoform X2 n=1 Tax=Cucumis melo TaxID=3656 RepID=A0ABM3L887_CUCME|nr:uncharacterized protein LOC103502987 isoform X2 [Cucumis melo]
MRIQSWTCNIEEHQDASSPIFEMFSSRNKISIVELNDDNFLLWRFQVVTALEGYDLEKYLDSSLEPPSQFFNVKVETPQPPLACLLTNYPNSKPRIQEVKTQDQLISSWLLGLMNEDILNQMLNCNSTKDIWANLHGIYFARCLAQAMQLKSKLQNIKKRVVPLKEYFMKIQQCVDALASVAMVASHDLNMDSNWYPDSDVTNHLTNNFNNQFIGFKYRGERQVYDANGSGLSHWPNTSPRTAPWKSLLIQHHPSHYYPTKNMSPSSSPKVLSVVSPSIYPFSHSHQVLMQFCGTLLILLPIWGITELHPLWLLSLLMFLTLSILIL